MITNSTKSVSSHLSNVSIKHVVKGLGTDQFSCEVPAHAIEGLRTDLSGPEVSTYNIEVIMAAKSPTEPTFLNSKPMHTGRKQKAKDMSGLTLCFYGDHAKPGDVGSIRC